MEFGNHINGNSASGTARLINIVQNINIQNGFPKEPSDDLLETFREHNPVARALGAHGNKFFSDEQHDVYAEKRSPTMVQAITPRSVARVPLQRLMFDDDLDACVDRYPNLRISKSVMESLDPRDRRIFSEWVGSHRNVTLPFYVQGEQNKKSKWTTDFTLEVMGSIIRLDTAPGTPKGIAVVTHFFGERNLDSPWTQKDTVREFIVQLRRACTDGVKNGHIRDLRRDDDILHLDVKCLWELLVNSVGAVKLKSLYMILDNVDALQDHLDSNDFKSFCDNIQHFLAVCQENDKPVSVKLLVTGSRLKEGIEGLTQDIQKAIKLTTSSLQRHKH